MFTLSTLIFLIIMNLSPLHLSRLVLSVAPGAPEAVLDWGGGGGKDLRGLTIFFFLLGAHQWRRQLFGMEGGGEGYHMYRQKIAHRTRGSICYHNFS